VGAAWLGFGEGGLASALLRDFGIYFAFGFGGDKGRTDDSHDPVVYWLSDYPVLVDWIWLFENVLEIVGGPFFVRFAIGFELFGFICDLVEVGSGLLLAVGDVDVLVGMEATLWTMGEKARLVNCLLDFIIQNYYYQACHSKARHLWLTNVPFALSCLFWWEGLFSFKLIMLLDKIERYLYRYNATLEQQSHFYCPDCTFSQPDLPHYAWNIRVNFSETSYSSTYPWVITHVIKI